MRYIIIIAMNLLLSVMKISGQQTNQSFDSVNYLLYLPEGYSLKDKEWPLLLFLHGSGERGADLELVKRHGPPKLIEEGKRFPFIVVSPQCPAGKRWSVDTLMNFTNYLLSAYPVDKNRVYLTGLSMGGQGTWSFATAHPDIFAALLPICGRTEPGKAEALKEMPIWVFHGAKDDIISIKYSEDMVNALKKYDAPVKFTIYPEAGHDSWTETYSNQKVYKWLVKQHREAK